MPTHTHAQPFIFLPFVQAPQHLEVFLFFISWKCVAGGWGESVLSLFQETVNCLLLGPGGLGRVTARSRLGVGLHHLCLSSRSMFLCQGFRKYLPEVKKESALHSSTQSSEPSPRSPRERQPRGSCRHSPSSIPAARFMPRCSRTMFLG